MAEMSLAQMSLAKMSLAQMSLAQKYSSQKVFGTTVRQPMRRGPKGEVSPPWKIILKIHPLKHFLGVTIVKLDPIPTKKVSNLHICGQIKCT